MLTETSIARILYVLISIELTTTILFVPASRQEFALFAVAIVCSAAVCVRLATIRKYDVPPDPGNTGDRPDVEEHLSSVQPR